MNILLTLEEFDENNIFLSEPIRNNLINNGTFVRFLYSTSEVVMNSLHFFLALKTTQSEKYFNKIKFSFSQSQNLDVINNFCWLEHYLLDKFCPKERKTQKYQLKEQLHSGCLKACIDESMTEGKQLVLRISGIWMTEAEYGLTFKVHSTNL